MNIVWSEKTIRWMAEASAFTGYHKKLAAVLAETLPGGGTLADLGCGTGLIDLELAPRYERVTCVDVSAEALTSLRAAADVRGLGNIETRLADAKALTERFDDVIAVFFSDADVIVNKLVPTARRGFAAVVHVSPEGKFGPENYRMKKADTASAASALFERLGIEYKRTDMSLEYGQPFRTVEDAREFTRAYSDCPPDAAVDEYLEKNLVATGERDFPLYLPNEKYFSILSVLKRPDGGN
jgi:SAM-dependent methyltransferase